ncbi:MAG: bifunctional phosphoribosylaminoimidazolecarboxamide formyltransferase/IMP cyclohydrolase [Bacteroidota bacterium]
MTGKKRIKNVLVSAYHKQGLENLLATLRDFDIQIFSTGGTYEFITGMGISAIKVEDLTGYPSILGGRVKTLHPAVFGGILARRSNAADQKTLTEYNIPVFDMVVVDLYPFEETVASGATQEEIIEKIDIGGISLIRAAAKNFNDVLVVSSRQQYEAVETLLREQNGYSTTENRKKFAAEAFAVSSGYDVAICNYFGWDKAGNHLRIAQDEANELRYGENPHQSGTFFGKLNDMFTQLHGKAISYNNLLDLDAGINLINEFTETTFAVLKHNNVCGIASRDTLADAWKDALAGDPVSAFGGVLITNKKVDFSTAKEINKLFFEIILAPGYEEEALTLLKSKKNRIILKSKNLSTSTTICRTVLNGFLMQERDMKSEMANDFSVVTQQHPTENQKEDLIFANILVKHTKSNAIVLTKNKQLIACGTGQTSRVDALKQAIEKAKQFKHNLAGAVMASDAFFPFADSVEIANKAGINAIIQPGGSIRDKDSIAYCDQAGIAMVFTGIRHFKH